MTIDLRNCRPGDKLLTRQNKVVEYVGPLPETHYYDHEVRYANGSIGTRCHDGFTYRNEDKRMPEDEDIIEVLPSDTPLRM